MAKKADIKVENHGSIFLLCPRSEPGRDWLREHTYADALTWAGAVVVEPRYVEDIVRGAQDDGLEVV